MLDTNICIYALNHRPPEVRKKLEAVGRAAISLSVITVHELRLGAEKSMDPGRAHDRLDAFLTPLRVLSFDQEAALASARVRGHLGRTGRKIGALDNLIAGHALATKQVLVTNNEGEFSRIPGLVIENWMTP